MNEVKNSLKGQQKMNNDLYSQFKQDKCSLGLSEVSNHFNPITTDWSTWTYQKRLVCPSFDVRNYRFKNQPPVIYIKCETTNWHQRNQIQTISHESDCVNSYIKQCCTDKMTVPKIVHYVWYGLKVKFDFYGFLSFISALRFVRPCLILIHGNILPQGLYWKFIINIYPNIIHVERLIESNKIFGKKVKHINNLSDVIRIEALLKYGGIYLDMDMVLMRDVDLLRQYPCTMSYLRPHFHLGSSYIMAERNSTFMQKWLDGYKYHYRNDSYSYSAMRYPYMLATNFTDLIHVENETISRPYSLHGVAIFKHGLRPFDWSKLYGVHLYSRKNEEAVNEMVIRDLNTTFGAIARHIIFGNKELCSK